MERGVLPKASKPLPMLSSQLRVWVLPRAWVKAMIGLS